MSKKTNRKTNLKHPPHLKLKGYLAENKIKQSDIARLLKLTPVTVNKKINGSLVFTFPEVEAICDAYNISPNLFLTKKVAQ